jgi:hypothetical protein
MKNHSDCDYPPLGDVESFYLLLIIE